MTCPVVTGCSQIAIAESRRAQMQKGIVTNSIEKRKLQHSNPNLSFFCVKIDITICIGFVAAKIKNFSLTNNGILF